MECRSFAAEAKKVATAEYSSVQGELGDAQKRLAPHLRMRVDYEQNVEGMEEMYVVTNKLGAMEVVVEHSFVDT